MGNPKERETAKAPAKSSRKAGPAVGARSKGKHPGGRPTDYRPDLHPMLAEAWATAGRTDKQIAEKLGVAESTLYAWKKDHPEFSEALNRGKVEPDDKVEACLFARATGYDHEAVKIFMPANAPAPVYAKYIEHFAPDVTAQIFWLKNRRPDRWRDRMEHTGADGGPIETAVSVLTYEQALARLAELRKADGDA